MYVCVYWNYRLAVARYDRRGDDKSFTMLWSIVTTVLGDAVLTRDMRLESILDFFGTSSGAWCVLCDMS